AGSVPWFWLATVGEPRQARDRWREGRARRAWTEGRSRIERRDDLRLENRSRALRRNAHHERWQRGPAARAAGLIRAVVPRGALMKISRGSASGGVRRPLRHLRASFDRQIAALRASTDSGA